MNTSTETISEKVQNIKTAQLEEILKVSGSSAITKNEYGITIVNENDSASSLILAFTSAIELTAPMQLN